MHPQLTFKLTSRQTNDGGNKVFLRAAETHRQHLLAIQNPDNYNT